MKSGEPSTENPRPSSYRWVILVLSVLVVLAALGLGRFGFTMILPAMKAGLRLSESGAGSLVTVSLAGYLLMALTVGRIIARFGSRIVISGSLLLLAASLLLIGLSRRYGIMLVFCFFSGLGSGGANVGVMGLPSVWFPKERRGMAGGIIVSGSSFAILLTGIILPRVLAASETTGWRHAWMLLSGAVFVVASLSILLLRIHPARMRIVDFALGKPASSPLPAATNDPAPMASIYRTGGIWHLGVIYVMFGFSYIIYATFFANYLVREIGLSLASAGRLWSGVGIVSMVSGFLWGTVSDKIGRKYGLAIVFLLQTASYAFFGFSRVPAFMYLSALLFALTSWSIPAIMAAATGNLVRAEFVPAAFGFITFFFGIGQVLAPVTAGRLAETAGTLRWSFMAAAGAAFLGALGSLLLKRGRKAGENPG